MQSLKKYYFAKVKAQPNTFIGGVSATVSTASLVAGRLGIAVNRIKAFKITGSDIGFSVTGGNYTIANGAFAGLTSLTYFNDAAGLVTGIGSSSFSNCTNATSYYFPEVTTITTGNTAGTGTFTQNTALTALSFPKLTTLSGGFLCYFCGNLVTFYAPLLTGNLPQYTFFTCSNMTTLTVGVITSIGIDVCAGASKLTAFDFTNISIVPDDSFVGCTLLSSIGSLNNVTTIGNNAFSGCSNISGTITANSLTTIANNGFRACSKVTSYSFPVLTTINDSTGFSSVFSGNTLLTSFSAPLLTSITNNYTFFASNNITTFYAPLLILNSSNWGTFYGLSNLVSLTIGKPTGLGNTAFLSCAKITSIDLTNCTYLGDSAFQGCSLLSAVNAPILITCGTTTGNNSVFNLIKTGITITVPIALKTANAGAPDGDLVYASGTRGATIVYV